MVRSDFPQVRYSVIISVYNEETTIVNRIENVKRVADSGLVEIVVASDGSRDDTVKKVTELNDSVITLLEFKQNRGKALVHNECARIAKGDILIFTDAETSFADDFFNRLLPHFKNPQVGAVCGSIHYINRAQSTIGQSVGLYWKYEDCIRKCQSNLGVLAFGTGACMAVRKSAYRPIQPKEDVDFALTMDLVADRHAVIYEPSAMAYDYISETQRGTFTTKVQQTSQSFKSILKRLFSVKFLSRPVLFLSILCHKTFRHLSPFFMITMFCTNLVLAKNGTIYVIIIGGQAIFYFLVVLGVFFTHRRLSILNLPFQFVMLNISRAIGVLIACMGKETGTFRTVR